MTAIEKAAFLKLFNNRGYVLNFSTNDFNIFTTESVGIPLCQKYGLSKGASLTAFCSEYDDFLVNKLLFDLLRYYELHLHGTSYENNDDKTLYERCRDIMERDTARVVKVATPAIKSVDRQYIRDIAERALHDIEQNHYDSAITKARTLLEEVFCLAIERKDEKTPESGDIGDLYRLVKQLYNMHQSPDMDRRINGLLSGLEKILSAIANMRNKGSDAHGLGANRINIDSHHARLFVNSAVTMADFILSVSEKHLQNTI